MGNWVIICHGGVDADGGQVQIPPGGTLRFWINHGKPILVSQAEEIVKALKRDPDPNTIPRLLKKVWPDEKWDETDGEPGQWTSSLWLQGDPAINCVGVLNLQDGQFSRWESQIPYRLKDVLALYEGNVDLICCRTSV
jgi:hypothetical protein